MPPINEGSDDIISSNNIIEENKNQEQIPNEELNQKPKGKFSFIKNNNNSTQISKDNNDNSNINNKPESPKGKFKFIKNTNTFNQTSNDLNDKIESPKPPPQQQKKQAFGFIKEKKITTPVPANNQAEDYFTVETTEISAIHAADQNQSGYDNI